MLRRLFAAMVALLVVLTALGCRGGSEEPRVRFGCYPTPTVGATFLNPTALGQHGYRSNRSEKNGIVYTCQGGHIDVAHLRLAADWTAYLTKRSFQCLMENEAQFSYKLGADRSRHYVEVSYPEDWARRPAPERAAAARESAAVLGPHLAFTMMTWHEVLTWFGYKYVGLPTAFASAFSWEDSYSNLLGTIVAVRALQDTEHSYDEAVTIALNEELERLGTLPARVAKDATAQVKGDWFTGSVVMFVDIMKRNFDIGLDDGLVTPTLLENVAACGGAQPMSYPVPRLDVPARHGFSVRLVVEPREWEKHAILAVVYPDAKQKNKRIDLTTHLPRIMDYIKQDAARRYGRPVDARSGTAGAP